MAYLCAKGRGTCSEQPTVVPKYHMSRMSGGVGADKTTSWKHVTYQDKYVAREVFFMLKMHVHVSPNCVYLIKVSMERGTSTHMYTGHPLSHDSNKLFLSARYSMTNTETLVLCVELSICKQFASSCMM
jgi:hypothetical protein